MYLYTKNEMSANETVLDCLHQQCESSRLFHGSVQVFHQSIKDTKPTQLFT